MATGGSGHDGEKLCLSELRIVLLGAQQTGKSSAGNTILGREEFKSGIRTAQCEKRQGEVAGRQVTVVDTPGWFSYFHVDDSPGLMLSEIKRSVNLCSPGPHALLLVIDGDSSFQEKNRRSVEEHLEFLSEAVWSHTIVLFTTEDHLGEKTIEQHIQTEGKDLQWILQKCGNRYHVLSNKNRHDATQVTELLDKIEKMVVGNGGGHFHLESKVLLELEEERKMMAERVRERVRKVQKQREKHQVVLKEEINHLSELRIVLLGWVVGGKSSSGNTILGKEEFGAWRRTGKCEKKQGTVARRKVTVVDTPGWWKFISVELTPDWVKEEIMNSFTMCPPGPHTILLVIPTDTSFREEQRKIIRDHMRRLGDRVWRHTIVLFTWGECLGNHTIEDHIEREGKALQWVIEKCGNRYHVFNNLNRQDETQVTELLEKIEEMEKGNSVFHLGAETHGEVLEKTEEMETDISVDNLTDIQRDPELHPDRVRELRQTLDETWIRREEEMLEELGLHFLKETDRGRQTPQREKGKRTLSPPDNFKKVFEKEWNRKELGLMHKKKAHACTEQPYRRKSQEIHPIMGKQTSSECGSLEGTAGSPQEEESVRQETERDTQTPHRIEGEDTVLQIDMFEKEWNRRESEIICHLRRMIQDCTTLPVRRGRSLERSVEMRGDTISEPDCTDLTWSCVKVYDWMSKKHSGRSGAVSGYESGSAVSDTEMSDSTGMKRKQRLGDCGAHVTDHPVT